MKIALTAAAAVFVIAILARISGLWPGSSVQPGVALGPAVQVTPIKPPAAEPTSGDPRQPDWRRFAATVPAGSGRAKIVLVIDDLGLKRAATLRLAGMPGPLTLAFLPYADGLPDQAEVARAAGHELIVHLPMAPKAADSDPGPMALLSYRDKTEFTRRLDWNLSRFAGFVGVNNHMGSRLTEDSRAMRALMAALSRKGLIFLDSRTTPGTVAGRLAAAQGVPFAERDVFLDNVQEYDAINARLAETEAIARENGLAIAIGHPHDVTLDAIAAWMAGLKDRGLVLVPLTAAVQGKPHRPAARGTAGAAAASSG